MSGAILGLDHVQVAAPSDCEEDARRFYGGLLGLAEIAKPRGLVGRGGVWFRVGAQELHVGVAEQFAPATKAHPALRVSSASELEQLAARLTADGVEVRWADPAEIPGVTRFFVDDPWGNRLEMLATCPRATVRTEGHVLVHRVTGRAGPTEAHGARSAARRRGSDIRATTRAKSAQTWHEAVTLSRPPVG
jgi:catechol 2,3-dioxygenase-like lactoylglutathione lyase family enzyme